MISIDTAQFRLNIQNEAFARTLYMQWDEFCRISFEKIVEEVLSPFDDGESDLSVERLVLDLGQVAEKDFYEEYPRRLKKKLSEVWQALSAAPAAHGLTRTSLRPADPLDQISFYLQRGFLPKTGASLSMTPRMAADEAIKSRPEHFRTFLQREGWNPVIQKRLTLQLEDPVLERIIALTHPEQSVFIARYARSLIDATPQLTTSPGRMEYRNAVWQLLFSYLYSRNKGRFSRRELVRQTLSDLAARFSIKPSALLAAALVTGRETLPSDGDTRELLVILEEIELKERNVSLRTVESAGPDARKEHTTEREQVMPGLASLKVKWESLFPAIPWERQIISGSNTLASEQEIKAWADSPSLILWLDRLNEKETEDWARHLLPREESTRLISYVRSLQKRGYLSRNKRLESENLQTVLWAVLIQNALGGSSSGASVTLIKRLSAELPQILEEIVQKGKATHSGAAISSIESAEAAARDELPGATAPLPARLALLKDKWESRFPDIPWEHQTLSGQSTPENKEKIKAWADSPSLILWLDRLDEKETEDWVRHLLPREDCARFLACARILKTEMYPSFSSPAEQRKQQTILWACLVQTALEHPSSGANLRLIIQEKLEKYGEEAAACSSTEKGGGALKKETLPLTSAKFPDNGHSSQNTRQQTSGNRESLARTNQSITSTQLRKQGGAPAGKASAPSRNSTSSQDAPSPLRNQRSLIYPFPGKEEELPSAGLHVPGAGLILFSPWLPLFFEKTGLLNKEKSDFSSPDARIRALFLMQALLYEEPEREFEEEDLALCRVLAGASFDEPLPRYLELTEKERELAGSLLSALVQNWDKLKETSPRAIRESFLIRPGVLQDQDKGWTLTLEPRPYDILLDSLPWNYTLVKMPWMSKMLTTKRK